MGDLVTVQAGWAIWSKHPGTRDDYSVLHSSAGPLSKAEFSSVLAHFAPGNPPPGVGTPSSLPWVTFNRVGVAEKTYLGASVQSPTEHVDATGRPVSQTSYLCIPYDDLARDPVSYRALSEALSVADLPYQDGLLPLTLPRLDPGEMARSIGELGPEFVAAVAALLLAGPVTITGPDFPDWDTRVRLLDAVAALLPYGYRTSYTAATWSDTGAGSRFRLVFANRARDDASRITWGASVRVPAEGPARKYFAYLHRITGQPSVDTTELARLIEHLASATAPCKFEQPEQALASLGELFHAEVVAEAVDAGAVNVTEIRRIFAQNKDGHWPPERRRQMFCYLIEAGDAQDWQLISERFSAIANGDAQALLPSVAQGCRRLLWSGAAKDLVATYLRLADAFGLVDELLARLMVKPRSSADLETGLETAGALLSQFVVNGPLGPKSWPRTQQAVAHNPGAGTALLAYLSASKSGFERLGVAVEWLEPVLDPVLPLFNAVLGGGVGAAVELVDTNAIAKLNRDGGRSSVGSLLRAASNRRCLPFVLPGLASWLALTATEQGTAEATEPGGVSGRFWDEVARELTPATSAEAAWVDLALLASGNNPRTLLTGKFPHRNLNRDLTHAWSQLITGLEQSSRAGRAADALLTGALIRYLGRHEWRDNEAHEIAVMDLAAQLTVGGARPRLMSAVLDPAEALRRLPSRASTAQIAEVCERAYAGGLPADQTGDALAESRVITSGRQAADVVERLHRTLCSSQSDASYQWEHALARRFADGSFGEQASMEFARCIARSSHAEIGHQLMLLDIAVDARIAGAPPVLTDTEADQLEMSERFLRDILRDARKRQGGLFSSRRRDSKEGE
jgi:hypothetical protein